MSDELNGLNEILAMDGGPESPPAPHAAEAAAPEPLDGAPPEDATAEPDEDEGEELSAEERVAEMVRADAEAEGVALEDEPSDDEVVEAEEPVSAEAESDEDLAALIEEGRRARAEREAADAAAPFQTVYADLERDIAHAKAHYAQERRKARQQCMDEAKRSVDPDAYINTHLDAYIDSVANSEEGWIAELSHQAQRRIDAIQQERADAIAKPKAAARLVENLGLPKSVIPRLMEAQSMEHMLTIGNALADTHKAFAAKNRKHRAEKQALLAKQVKANQVHPGSSGRGATGKVPTLKGTADELPFILP